MPEETMSRELRIPLPQAEPRECFLAIPFDGRNDIAAAIAHVVTGERILRKRTDTNPESSSNWPQNVVQGIRRADVIIAVINNKEDHPCRINANVAYEIGIAHALEKPLIIVARNQQEDEWFFKDVSKCLWLYTHPEGRFEDQLFVKDLKIRLTSELAKKYSSYTWQNAKIIERQPFNADGLEKAFNYGKQVHEAFQYFVRGHVTPLSEAALTLSYGRAIDPKEYRRIYESYLNYYKFPVEPLLDRLPAFRDEVVNANSSWRHSGLQYHCGKVYEATGSIRGYYEKIKAKHENTTGQISEENGAHNRKLCADIDMFRKHCTDVISAAGAYLTCLVETLIQINKEQCSD